MLIQPLSIHQRTPMIDVLRGWALLGVAVTNYRNFYYIGYKIERVPGAESFVTLSESILGYLFFVKSWTLLSILFGYGFSVLIQNIQANVKSPASFFLRRMFWLLLFGCINSLLFFGDVLRFYAVLGIILFIFFYQTPAKRVFYVSVTLMAIFPLVDAYIKNMKISYWNDIVQLFPLYYSDSWLNYFTYNLGFSLYFEILNLNFSVTDNLMMFSCMLLGVAAHRSNFIDNILNNKKLIKRIFWACLFMAIVLNLAHVTLTQSNSLVLHYFQFKMWAIISITLTISAGVCWLYLAGRLKIIFKYLETMGRMALTNYITQSVFIALIFSGAGLGLHNTRPYWFYLALGFCIYIIQIIVSRYWLSQYNYGPLEWIWRKLSYGNIVSFKKQQKIKSSFELN
jgi:uncharacterized protein